MKKTHPLLAELTRQLQYPKMYSHTLVLSKGTTEQRKALNSNEGFKYLLIIWTIIGVYPPKCCLHFHWCFLYFTYAAVMNLLSSFWFPVSMWIDIYFVDSYQSLVVNLSSNVSISMSVVKQLIVIIQRQRLLKSAEYLRLLDQRSACNSQDQEKILKAIRYSHLYALYLPVYWFCACGLTYTAWLNQRLIYSAWYPDLFTHVGYNFRLAFIGQYISQMFICCQSVFNDTFPLCYLSIMIGQLESLANRIERIGWDATHTVEENIAELTNCVTDHKHLLSYFDCIRPLISNILLLQFLITALVLCLTAINLTIFSQDLQQQFFIFLYLVILLIQILPCCWHVNTVMEKSDYLTMAMYSCNWMDQNKKFRKMLIIFMQRSQKTNTILAGNLAPATLQTFVAIIRFSFSLFTVLSKM